VRRRIDIEPHDVLQLVGELRIIQEFELPDAVRLETVSPPNALHRTDAECLPFSPSWRRSSASLRREGWRVGQCQSDDAFGDVIVERLDARGRAWMIRMSVPFSRRWVAKLWRNVCSVTAWSGLRL